MIVLDGKEKSIQQKRVAHMQGLSLNVMRDYGLSVSMPELQGVTMETTGEAVA